MDKNILIILNEGQMAYNSIDYEIDKDILYINGIDSGNNFLIGIPISKIKYFKINWIEHEEGE